ncbi:MAG: DUF2461 domain-containing protein [Prevotellaceae bacterium]|jgi:uncharacterized protein (TIGR02453 family)|nr:DUF2461 domain-containing protein [Prevotellaceae bacterium]
MMIQKLTLDFLKQLSENNYREWFHEHKAEYEVAKQNVLDTTAAMLVEINKFDKSIALADPKKCIFRIARDTRFATNKSPYKTNFGVIMNAAGSTRSELPGYYMHIEPGNCFVSCGIYMPSPQVLKTIRAAIEDDWSAFSAIINKKAFKESFGTLCRDENVLSRVPQGFDKDSPASEFLKLKHFYVHRPITNKEVCSRDYIETAAHYYKLMQPLNNFLHDAVLMAK